MKKNWHLSLALVCVILGALLATSFNTQQRNYESLNSPRKKDLIKVVSKLEGERDTLKRQIEDNREQIAKHEKSAAQSQGMLTTYIRELEQAKKAAGLTQIKGPGLIITLGDSQQYPKDDDPNNYVIHDYDIRLIVNGLWAGGAEAITVNGQRLISTSSIRCAGSTILINSTMLVSPYKIKAVGNTEKMLSILNSDKNTKRLLNEIAGIYGLQVMIEQKSEVVIAGYSGGLLVENAKVIGGED